MYIKKMADFISAIFLYFRIYYFKICACRMFFQQFFGQFQQGFQFLTALEGVVHQQDFFGVIGNHGTGVVAGWIAEGTFFIKEGRKELNIQHIFADTLISGAFGGAFPSDTTGNMCQIVSAHGVAGQYRKVVIDVYHIIDVVKSTFFGNSAAHGFTGIAVAVGFFPQCFVCFAGGLDVVPFVCLRQFHFGQFRNFAVEQGKEFFIIGMYINFALQKS